MAAARSAKRRLRLDLRLKALQTAGEWFGWVTMQTSTDLAKDDEIDLLSLFRTLWRGKYIILALTLAGAILAFSYATFIASPSYRAATELSIDARAGNPVDLTSVLSGISTDTAALNTEIEIIRSRELLGRVVDTLDLTADPEFNAEIREPGLRDRLRALLGRGNAAPPSAETIRNDTIGALREAIAASSRPNSYVFNVAVTANDPAKAALIANAVAGAYISDQIAIKNEATAAAAVWLSEQVAELQVELESTQTAINERRANSLVLGEDLGSALNSHSANVATNLQAAELSLSRSRDRLAALSAAAVDDYHGRALAADDAQLRNLATAAASGDTLAIERFERRATQVMLQLRGALDRGTEAVRDLRQQADSIAGEYEQQSAALIEISQMERTAEATRVLYETFLTRLKETTLLTGIQQADSRILSVAIPGQQVAPRRSLMIAMAGILGLMAGSGLVLLREALRNTFRDVRSLEQDSGTAVLGQIPRIPAKGRAKVISYLASKPTSAAAEAVRNLRTSILMSQPDQPPQIILSTSSLPGEGKTTVAIALAQNLAGLNKRVLLVEGDIRRRTFGDYFPEAAGKPGLMSVITGEVPLPAAAFRHPEFNIDILMGEKATVNAADVFSSQRFGDLIAEIRAAYDYVIIDTPPVLLVPDARVISQHADARIYVVQWDKTQRAAVAEGLKLLNAVKATPTGMVLTQIDPKGMRRYGYGGYYAYDKSAKGYYDN